MIHFWGIFLKSIKRVLETSQEEKATKKGKNTIPHRPS